MAVVCSGEVESSIGGLVLTFRDTGTGYGTIVSRTLTISDAYGIFVTSFSMGTNLTQAYDRTSDAYLQFVLVVVDNTGTYTCQVNIDAQGIYIASFLNAMVATGCSCKSVNSCNLMKAELNIRASNYFSIPGLGPAAQYTLDAANIYVNANSN